MIVFQVIYIRVSVKDILDSLMVAMETDVRKMRIPRNKATQDLKVKYWLDTVGLPLFLRTALAVSGCWPD